ncbi:murein biosynthesis integral membrane protein MurJ [Proteinivorax tanatarense]|uniref:Probable lipid II flippase MurJ n=1 Tax=Proteinivorax tanatarense TaxID=1260629 RepID=A0AAU7VHT9_9FIRM
MKINNFLKKQRMRRGTPKINKLSFSSVLIIIGMLLNKTVGFIREMSIADAYGASATADIYLLAYMLPFVIFSILTSAIKSTFIPVFTDVKNKYGEAAALNLANSFINAMGLIGILIALSGVLLADYYVPIFAYGYEGQSLETAILLTRIMFPMVLILTVSSAISAILQVYSKFFIQTIVWTPHNIIIILYNVILSRHYGIEGLAVATIVAAFTQIAFQLPAAIKVGFKYKVACNFKDKYLKKMIKLMIPIFIGSGIVQINILVDKTLASNLVQGSIASLNFANRVYTLPIAIFVVSIGTAAYPELSRVARKSKRELSELTIKLLRVLTVILLPIATLMLVLRYEIIQILFERGEFDSRATALTATALFYYSFGMIGIAFRDILGRSFYALQDTKSPMINGTITVIMNIILNFVLIQYLDHGGLALATSIAHITTALLLLYTLNKKINLNLYHFMIFFIKIIFVSVILGVLAFAMKNLLSEFNVLFITSFSSAISLLLYVILLKKLKIEEFDYLASQIKEIIK